jgi:outer membrane protein assembly factor BamB
MSMTRRRVLGAIGAGSFAAGVAVSLPAARAASVSDPTEWPQFKRDAGNTGYEPNVRLPDAVETKWRYSVDRPIQSAPAIAGGRCFVGANDGHCHAVDVETGESLWRVEVGDEVRSAPAVAGETVFIGGKRQNYALSASSGATQWARRTTASAVQTAPTVAGRSVYISKGDEATSIEAMFRGSGDHRVTVESPLGPTTPAVNDGSIVAGFEDGTVRSWDTRITNEQWSARNESPVHGAPVIRTLGDDRRSSVVYTDRNGVLRALNATNGRLRWTYDLGATSGSPAVSGDRVVLGTGEYTLQAFNATGTPVWNRELAGRVVASPVLSASSVVVGGGSTLYALEAASGETRWSVDLDGRITRAAAVAGGFVVVGTDGGSLYALGASDADFGEPAGSTTATESPSPTETETPTDTATPSPTATRTPPSPDTPADGSTTSRPTSGTGGGSGDHTVLDRIRSVLESLLG